MAALLLIQNSENHPNIKRVEIVNYVVHATCKKYKHHLMQHQIPLTDFVGCYYQKDAPAHSIPCLSFLAPAAARGM